MYYFETFNFAELSRCQSTTTYTNPIIRRNHPDPGVLTVPGKSGYVLVSTSNLNSPDNGPAFPIMFSYDLVNWERKGYVFNTGEWPSWAQVWSHNEYYLHFMKNLVLLLEFQHKKKQACRSF